MVLSQTDYAHHLHDSSILWPGYENFKEFWNFRACSSKHAPPGIPTYHSYRSNGFQVLRDSRAGTL